MKAAQHDVVFINFFDKSVALSGVLIMSTPLTCPVRLHSPPPTAQAPVSWFCFEALCQTFATTLWHTTGQSRSNLLNAQSHTSRVWKGVGCWYRQGARESLEKRKSNKLNWFVRSYLCSLRRRLSSIITTRTRARTRTRPRHIQDLHWKSCHIPSYTAGTTRALRCVLRF